MGWVNGLYDVGGLGDSWQAAKRRGWPSKDAWRDAGKPAGNYPGWTPPVTPTPPVQPPAPPNPQVPKDAPPASDSGGGFNLSEMLSGIPTTYLLIGGVIIAFMVLKKR